MLQNYEATIRGLRVDALKAVVVEVFGFPRIEEEFLVRDDAITTMNDFTWPRENLDSLTQDKNTFLAMVMGFCFLLYS